MTDQSWPRTDAMPFPAASVPPSPRALAASEPFLAVAGVGAWMYEAGTQRLWWSAETRRIHGVPDGYRPTRDRALAFYPPEARDRVTNALIAAIEHGRDWDLEVPLVRADGRTVQVRARGRAWRPDDAAIRVLGTLEDVTDRYEAAQRAARELALRAQTETLLRDVIQAIPASLAVYDAEERLVLTNDTYRRLLPDMASYLRKGDRLADIVTRKVADDHYAPEVRGHDSPEVRQAWVADYLARHRTPGYSRIFHLRDGRWMQASAAHSASGNIVSLRTDITALKEAEAELRRIAEQDALTGLANRDVLLRRLAGLNPETGLLLLVDVDFFKAVNDGLGHAAGDLLLRLVGRRLQRLAGPGDIAARLAGDEFALVMADAVDAEAALARVIRRLRRPLRLGSTRYAPSLSIGAARPVGGDAKTLLANADAALYEAKRQGRSRAELFDAAMAARVSRRSRLADRLRAAIAARRLTVALQPQVDARGRVAGFEALARWQDEGEWISPGEFVPIAEDVGLAQPLGTLVMDLALGAFARMLRAGLEPGQLAVNISTAQLLADDFIAGLRALLHRHRLPASRLEVEVTETVLLDRSIARIGRSLETLRAMGVSLALDDFGTGYASLSHLTSFPVDRIKIDQRFTGAIGCGDRGLIARSIIALGRGLGLGVVAEGVETEAQKQFLLAEGCTALQGYLIARPMLETDAQDWLAARPA